MQNETQPSVSLSPQERQRLNSQRIPYPISPYEIQVIKALREVRYGNLTIHVQAGVALKYTQGGQIMIEPFLGAEEHP